VDSPADVRYISTKQFKPLLLRRSSEFTAPQWDIKADGSIGTTPLLLLAIEPTG